MVSQTGKQILVVQILLNISLKGHRILKFGQIIE